MQTIATAAHAQGIGLHRKGPHPRHLSDHRIDVSGNRLLATAALIFGHQPNKDKAAVGAAAKSGDREQVLHLAAGLQRCHQRLDLVQLRVGIAKAYILRRLHDQEDRRAVFGRGQLLFQAGIGEKGRCRKQPRRQQNRQGHLQGAVQRPAIGSCQRAAQPVQRADLIRRGLRQRLGRHHRRQRQRHHSRDHNRNRQRKAKLAKQPPHLPRQEGNRHKHRHQRGRGCQHREIDLLRAHHSRRPRAHALPAQPHDVFQHHNRVIHHQTRGQNQGQQRQDIDRKPREIDPRQGPRKRHRHRDRRNKRRAPIAQKQKDNRRHHQHRDHHRPDHLADRALDKDRVI